MLGMVVCFAVKQGQLDIFPKHLLPACSSCCDTVQSWVFSELSLKETLEKVTGDLSWYIKENNRNRFCLLREKVKLGACLSFHLVQMVRTARKDLSLGPRMMP